MKSSYLVTISISSILAFTMVTVCLAFSQAVYSGHTIAYLPYGIVFTLLGSGILILVLCLFGDVPSAIGRPQDEPLPLIILLVQMIGSHFSNAQAGFATIFITLCLTGIMTGCMLYLCGLLKWGKYARYIPFPVIAGLLGGSGLLLMISCLEQILPMNALSLHTLSQLMQPQSMLLWIPSISYGLIIFLITEKYHNPLLFPASILAGIALFYFIFFLSDASLSSLQSMGLLLKVDSISVKSLFHHLNLSEGIQWSMIIDHIKWMVMIGIISILTLMFIIVSLEISFDKDINCDKELKIAGIANILSGLVGGIVGYHGLSNGMIANKFKVNNRFIGVICAFACFLAIFFPSLIISYFPRFMLIGLIFFLGLTLFYSWTLAIYHKFNLMDKFIIIGVIFTMLVFSFVYAMLIGVLIAIVFFAYTYSQFSNIRYVIRGVSSYYERDHLAKKILDQNKEKIVYIKLQGYLFFGSANTITEHFRELMLSSHHQSIKYVIYDMSQVLGSDTSCILSFNRISEYAVDHQCEVYITGLDGDGKKALIEKLSDLNQRAIVIVPKTNDAINMCELSMLRDAGYDFSKLEKLTIFLEDYLGDKAFLQDINQYFDEAIINEGDYLIHQNDHSHELFYLESGMVAVYSEQNANTLNLVSIIGPGNFIGEIAFYLHSRRTTSVIALKESKIKKINFSKAKEMKQKDPELSLALEQAIITSLSYKLINMTKKFDVVSK